MNEMEMVYWLAISEIYWRFPPRMLERALEEKGSIKEIWWADRESLLKWGMGHKQVERFIRDREKISPERSERFKRMLKEIKDHQIRVIPYTDPNYPKVLKRENIWPSPRLQPPRVLFHKGKLLKEIDEEECVAIIGRRNCSTAASNMAREFGKALVKKGFIVVSGLATGVDMQAHKGAIEVEGKTVAVLPWLNPIYPQKNKNLADNIAKYKYGCLLSECYRKPKERVKWRIWERNKITTGLSHYVIVIEAGISGGSISTAESSINRGIKTYILELKEWDNDAWKGFNKLKQKGAVPIHDPDDFLKSIANTH